MDVQRTTKVLWNVKVVAQPRELFSEGPNGIVNPWNRVWQQAYIHSITTIWHDDDCMAVDPVCRMNVQESQAKYTSSQNDKKYYFCSAACKSEFDRNPTKYI
ncbi:MAG: YHS domain-containing protein [Candidatus Bathyarchaeia archaeon]